MQREWTPDDDELCEALPDLAKLRKESNKSAEKEAEYIHCVARCTLLQRKFRRETAFEILKNEIIER